MLTCTQCQQQFEISPTGKQILSTLKIPDPQTCPACAVIHLMSFRNERTLYPNACQKCQTKILAMYPSQTKYTVYCRPCWWSDKWDATQYGLEYQGPASFFDQMKELQYKVPREGLVSLNSDNCDYCNHVRDCKDCYMCILLSDKCEQCYYGYWMVNTRYSADMYYSRNNERCYFCVATLNSYNCSYLLESDNCTDCHYSFDLKGCSNCMFSSNLRNKSYVFRNKQLSKTDYEKEAAAIKTGSWSASREYVEQFHKIISDGVHKYSNQIKCQKCIGDNIQNSTNAELCYNSFDDENVFNGASVICAKNIFNGFAVGSQPVEWSVNIAVIKGDMHLVGCYNIVHCNDIFFSENLVSCSDCIGCIGLNKKKFCVLNKQYTEMEYKQIKDELLAYWTANNQLSEFLPKNLSPFGYNETAAQDFYPKTKEQAVTGGYTWTDQLPGTFGKETFKATDLPDDISTVKDNICDKVLGCITCGRNYRVIKNELELYRMLNVPIPHHCFDCRLKARFDLMGDRYLQDRQCTCSQPAHGHENRCANRFMTKFKEPTPANIYCETCYQAEVQ